MSKKNITTFTGTQKGLTVIGDYCYAYTGNHPANTTSVEGLNFTTGKYIIVGKFQLNQAIGNADSSSGASSYAQIELNGNIVSHMHSGGSSRDPLEIQYLVIPPNTEVIVRLYSDEDQATRYITGVLTGRVYNG